MLPRWRCKRNSPQLSSRRSFRCVCCSRSKPCVCCFEPLQFRRLRIIDWRFNAVGRHLFYASVQRAGCDPLRPVRRDGDIQFKRKRLHQLLWRHGQVHWRCACVAGVLHELERHRRARMVRGRWWQRHGLLGWLDAHVCDARGRGCWRRCVDGLVQSDHGVGSQPHHGTLFHPCALERAQHHGRVVLHDCGAGPRCSRQRVNVHHSRCGQRLFFESDALARERGGDAGCVHRVHLRPLRVVLLRHGLECVRVLCGGALRAAHAHDRLRGAPHPGGRALCWRRLLGVQRARVY